VKELLLSTIHCIWH